MPRALAVALAALAAVAGPRAWAADATLAPTPPGSASAAPASVTPALPASASPAPEARVPASSASSPAAANARDAPAASLVPGRPKICLVLSGGGARGAAHVGVLKVLQEMHVPVDCVTGTSMGSIVGAAYASGATIEEMETVLGLLSTRLLFKELPPREERSVHLKRDDATNLAPIEFGIGKNGPELPKGFVSGVQLEAVLRALSKAHGTLVFDRLPIPFRAVATDLVTGKPVVLGDGELASAMRASMSVPGIIEPVRLQGRLLVDGGLTDNLPVDVAHAMGAQVVIAVNLGTPLLREDQIKSALNVTGQMVNILTEQNVQASLASLKPDDVLVVPQLGDYSAADFDNMKDTLPIGEAAARAVADRLAKYSVSPQEYAAWEARRRASPPSGQPLQAVDEIRFNDLKHVNPEVAQATMQMKPGEPIDPNVLDRDMQALFGTGDFEHVGFSILQEPGKRILSVDAVEKSWGPDYLRLGLGLSSDFRGDAFFNALASYRRTWVNKLGGEFRGDLQIGRTVRVAASFYQPLQPGPGFFVQPRVEYGRRSVDIFSADQRVAIFDERGFAYGLDLGAQFTRYAETRLGFEHRQVIATLDTGPPPIDALIPGPQTHAGLRWNTLVDQLDNVNFPRSGYAAKLDVFAANKGLGSDVSFTRLESSGLWATSFGDHTIQIAARYATRLGSDPLPPTEQFQWGGLLQQSGYPTGALLGQDVKFARLVYLNRVKQWRLLEGIYAGGSLEIGRVDQPALPGNEQGTLKSGALLLGLDTPLGPLYFGYGHANHGFNSLYLFLGRP